MPRGSARPVPSVPRIAVRRRPGGSGLLAALALGAVGFAGGLVTGSGCANSDQVLERKQRLAEIEGAGACRAGVTEDCYTGPKNTAERGACKLGKRSCQDGHWGDCDGQVVPTDELCNGLDDDCDGIVDNNFEREGALCSYEGAKGICRTEGKWHCSKDGKSSTCDAPKVRPKEETCDGTDEDCDGEVDEDSVAPADQPCSTGKIGVCSAGTNTCVNAHIRCIQNVQPGPEICNKLDDDCDGQIDNDCVTEAEAAKLRAQQKK